MLNLKNKIVLITGASSGIGKSCAEQFAAQGAKLILIARRLDRIQALAEELKQKYGAECLTIQLDVSDKVQVQQAIQQLSSEWKVIDILINNAGVALSVDKMQDANVDNWDAMLNTNVHGLLYVIHAILPGMVERNQGHIINLGSVAGRETYIGGNIYAATKFAVNAISKSLRLDLLGTNIRVTEIQPGAVETEFSEVRFKDKKRAKEFYQDFTPLTPDDIADSILYAATRPLHVNVAEVLIFPTAQASVTNISRGK